MKYNYQARTKTGELQTGVIEASSREAALNLLKSYNLYLTALEEVSPPFYARKIRIFERISKKEIAVFSRQLAIMFKSEIPLIEILQTVAKQTGNSNLREKILDMIERVEGGESLSKTFGLYPKIFSPFYVSMIKSGEASGKLSDVFVYLADHLEREYNFYGKIKGAMVYPIFVFIVFVAILMAMVTFVIPQLSQLLTEAGGDLPIVTKLVIRVADFLRKWGLVFFLVFVALIIFLFYFIRTKKGKIFLDKNLLKIPFISGFLKKIYLSRFALNLSTLISGGLPITHALEITADIVSNEVYKNIVLETCEGVKKGKSISSLLERYPKEITPIVIQMVAVGEKTGKLGSVLTNVVDFYQKEVDRTLDALVTILEPILIVFFGLVVAALMAAVVLPLYQIGFR